jgi:hypothetical protein
MVDHVERGTKDGLEAGLPPAFDQVLVDSGLKGSP